MTSERSLAVGQRSLGDRSIRYPLWPPLTSGCPRTSTEQLAWPVEVDYAYGELAPETLRRTAPGTGLERWAALLPPLTAPGLGEGGTPLIGIGDGVYVKDESRNPTWSHKDRLNRVTASAAVGVGAPGLVVASSGNHAASAAAYASRSGLRCVVLASADMPPAVASFVEAYGALVLPVPAEGRWPLMRRIVEQCGLHPVSNLTATHTGHAFGPEGYKTIAYEIFAELGVPAAVFAPSGYGELLFGIWKGFAELRQLGLAQSLPRVYGCEPAAGGPLAAALRQDRPAARVTVGHTDAYAIDTPVGGYRAVLAVKESGGEGVLVTDAQMHAAQQELAGQGMWAELSAAAGLAGLRAHGAVVDGPVVCVSTSSGFKDRGVGSRTPEPLDPSWDAVLPRLREAGIPGA